MSQGAGFQVDLDVLRQKARYVQELVPQIRAQLDQLDSEMESLFTTWRGQAATSFQTAHAGWHQSYLDLGRSLDGLGQELSASHVSYSGADEASTIRG
jgi:WXG100 family type VII secretion target